jgi:pimeloyl-ACP methyl ester carboxylesterase
VLYFAIVIGIAALLILCGVVYQTLGLRSDKHRFPAPGRLIDIGGHRLHLYEMGSGVSVVVESGISASSLNWRRVQNEVARFARVCSYDRPGLGWSDLCNQPCTPTALARQLHTLLQAAHIPAPYILVGHSFGALIVRAFATEFGNETVGLVLVDPLDPAEWSPISAEQQRMIAHGIRLARRGALAARLGVVRVCLNLLLAGNRLLPRAAAKAWSGRAAAVTDRIGGQVRKMPEETWPLVACHWKQPKCFEGMARHFECLAQSIAEASNLPVLELPVTMLAGEQNEHPTDQHLYAQRISTNTKLLIAEKSGHWIQLDEPELVVTAIREMAERIAQ